MRLRRRVAALERAAASPNQAPVSTAPSPSGPAQFMAGPEQQFATGLVLPKPSEAGALSVPAFWRGCAYVSGTVGMLPVIAYRGTDALDPQPAVLQQPDPNQTPMAFWAGVAESLTLYGNSINLVTSRDRLGYPLTLKPIHPTLAAVRFTGNPMAPTIATWYIAGQLYDPADVWHVKSHLGRAGWPLGRGLIDTDSDAIALAVALQGYSAAYFASGGLPHSILKIHRPEITQEQADAAKASWTAKFSGAPGVAVLNELTDFTPVSFNPVDSQMIESRSFSLIEIALLWGLPPSKLGANVGGSTYKNAQMEEVQARNDAVAPWTRLLAQAASLELLPRGQNCEWDLMAAIEADTLTKYQAYQLALGGPGPTSQWLLVDEIRSRENLDPMGDVAAELGVDNPLEAEPPPPAAVDAPPPVPALMPPDTPNEHPDGTSPAMATNGVHP
jgi:HK97 family phage portal protein